VNRRALWPDLRREWVVYEDEHLVALAKPAGVPSQAADPDWRDDLPYRLELAGYPYVGIHQRLDRDTSGVILYTKDRSANPGLAHQLEGRLVGKTYLAAVRGWASPRPIPSDRSVGRAANAPRSRGAAGRPVGRDGSGGGERTLRDRVVKGSGGAMRIAGGRDRRARSAVTHVREIERRGDRSLLEVRIETGRTHQIRVQLAHAGAPVAGDGLYGGPAASRLMLHASALELDHPVTGERLRLEAPVPPEMRDWLDSGDIPFPEDDDGLDRRLRGAAEARWGLGRGSEAPEPTTAFRLVNGAADGLPGLAVDVYGDFLVAHLYDDELPTERVLDALHRLGFDGVYLKRRPRQANELVDTRTDELAPREPVRGRAAPPELAVFEHGVPYLVRLGDGLSTGIFLDQRENRRRVRELAVGGTVLNLFAYTCPFTVAAAADGAARTLSIDAAAPALEQGARNVANVDPGGHHEMRRADAFEALEDLARRGERFDLVIVDPPTYSTTKRTRWTSGKDWVALGAAALRLTAPGGHLLACSNDQRLTLNAFRRHLHEAARRAGVEPRQMKDLPVPPDFPAVPGSPPHLKSVLIARGD